MFPISHISKKIFFRKGRGTKYLYATPLPKISKFLQLCMYVPNGKNLFSFSLNSKSPPKGQENSKKPVEPSYLSKNELDISPF